MRRGLAAVLVAVALALAASASAATPATPISGGATSSALRFLGAPARSQPLFAPVVPRNPNMAPNGRSNLHADAYMTDTYTGPGPLGSAISARSSSLGGDCASVTFDSRGRIVTVCVGLTGPTLVMVDRRSLATLATMALPPRQAGATSGSIFTDFAGGGYFYLDDRDRAVIPTTTRHIWVVAERASGPGFERVRDYDLTGVLAAGDKIDSALPDRSGRIWFVSTDGVVGTINPASGAVRTRSTGESISNSFAVDETGGVYVVTRRALYRFDARASGAPAITWREAYRNAGIHKPGQVDDGSGTTPTLMGRDWVSITDGADPIDVVVYRRARHVRGPRRVCIQPVFRRGASATDQSLIATRRSMIAENNYGYTGPQATVGGHTTTPGLSRVDVNRGDRGCHTVWTSREISPTAVPKLSLSTGLVYTYTKPAVASDPWYLTALDFRTGATAFKALAGSGVLFNNNYAPVTLGPDGSAYVGVIGGLAELRDATPPRRRVVPRPRLVLIVHRLASGRVRVRVGGRDARAVDGATYTVRGHRARASRPPFSRLIGLRALGPARRVRLSARVEMLDGRQVSLRALVLRGGLG